MAAEAPKTNFFKDVFTSGILGGAIGLGLNIIAASALAGWIMPGIVVGAVIGAFQGLLK